MFCLDDPKNVNRSRGNNTPYNEEDSSLVGKTQPAYLESVESRGSSPLYLLRKNHTL